jgi:hypothetical protein
LTCCSSAFVILISDFVSRSKMTNSSSDNCSEIPLLV